MVKLVAVSVAFQALAAEQAAAESEARRQAEDAAHRLQIQAQKAALVAPELAADSDVPHLTLLFRLPDGSRLSRRFGLQQHLQELYDFVDSKVRVLGLLTKEIAFCLLCCEACLHSSQHGRVGGRLVPGVWSPTACAQCLAQGRRYLLLEYACICHCTVLSQHVAFLVIRVIVPDLCIWRCPCGTCACRELAGCCLEPTSWCCSFPAKCYRRPQTRP